MKLQLPASFPRSRGFCIAAISCALFLCGCGRDERADGAAASQRADYAGSRSCRGCHPEFYARWENSRHGLAMQPYTPAFARANLSAQTNDISIGGLAYRFDIESGAVLERGAANPSGAVYRVAHVLGGKNVCYFLAPLERGRLQVLPIAWHVASRKWFDTTGSMVRNFHASSGDSALSWRDPMLTFNAACFQCHVSQLEKNYDAATGSYATIWREPGISCESCHGPSARHAAFYKERPSAISGDDSGIARWRELSVGQANEACAVCHAKMSPLTAEGLAPGQSFWDHCDLAALEDPDFSADGRDLGENYTYTLWLLNPCAKAGALSCVRCHTSSGRYRFASAKTVREANAACTDCHASRAASDAALSAHTHHAPDSAGSRCIACHMPQTAFAAMRRSDHSLRPPDPATARRFGAKSACVLCHESGRASQSASASDLEQWAASAVAEWRPKSAWREKLMREGSLVEAARNSNALAVPAILEYIAETNAEPIFAASLLRLMRGMADRRVLPVACKAAASPNPLVAASAAECLEPFADGGEARAALVGALGSPSRLVRIRAVQALAAIPESAYPAGPVRESRDRAERELLAAFAVRPDIWQSWQGLGNYRLAQRRNAEALAAYDRAIALRPDVAQPYVNASIAAARAGDIKAAVKYLSRAAIAAPPSSAVQLNLGLALAETGDCAGALKALESAARDPAFREQAERNIKAIRDFLAQ